MKQEKINSLDLIRDTQMYLKSKCPELTRFEFPVLGCIAVGLVRICGRGGRAELVCNERVDKRYMSEWYNDVGAIIINDIKKGTFNDYFEFNAGDKVGLLRRVTDDIVGLVNECGLATLRHGDFSYVLIRFRSADSSYVFEDENDKYVPEVVDAEDDSDVDESDVNDGGYRCVALF